jgi:hypothetical protein
MQILAMRCYYSEMCAINCSNAHFVNTAIEYKGLYKVALAHWFNAES